MSLTLEDVLNLPTDVKPDHLQMLGLLPPQPAAVVPPSGIAGVTPSTPGPAKPPSPIGPYDPSKPVFTKAGPLETRLTAASQNSPAVPMRPPRGDTASVSGTEGDNMDPNLTGMPTGGPTAETALAQVPAGGPGKLTFKQRQDLPTASPGVAPGSVSDYENQIDRLREQRQNPWGSPENHPGWKGKLAHVAAKIGNIAGDVVSPATMALIPGTDLNKRTQESNLETRLGEAQTRETTGELAKAKEKFEENTERINQQKADTGDRRADELEKKIEADERKTMDAHEIALRKLGLMKDPDNPNGAPIPLTRDRMSEAETSLLDYRAAQAEGVKAKGLYEEYLKDPNNPGNQEKLAQIKNMAVRAGQAAEALGIKKKEFLRDTYGTDENGDPIPGVETTDEGKPVGTKISAKNDKQRAAWEKSYEKPANDVERAYQMYREAQRAYASGDRKTGAATMLALSQHIGTTFGQVKGSRQTQDLIREHQNAIGWIDRLERLGANAATGDGLTADQMKEFGDLIENQRRLSWETTVKEANRNKIPHDFLPADLANLYKEAPGKVATEGKGKTKPAAAGGPAPAKTYTQADVDAAVQAHPGTTVDQIEKAFKDKNYTKH